MKQRKIVTVQGHPDPRRIHLGHALEDSYAAAALDSGHDVRKISVAELDFPCLRTKEEFECAALPEALQHAQQEIGAADHLAIFYPLWLGDMPAILKAFFEQVFRPDFVDPRKSQPAVAGAHLSAGSARVVVTMGMPSLLYRWYYGAYSVRSLERNILRFVGVRKTRRTLLGGVESVDEERIAGWLGDLAECGRRAR